MAPAMPLKNLALASTVVATRAKPPQDWMPRDAKGRFDDRDVGGLRSYLPGEASFIEVLTSQVYYVLNGCIYEDGDNLIIMLLRPLGWGCRMAFFLSSVIFFVLAMTRSTNPITQYSLSRHRDDDGVLTNSTAVDAFDWFVLTTFVLWVVSIASTVSTYLIGRYGAKNPYSTQLCAVFPFVLCNRTAIHDQGGDGTRCAFMLGLSLWFLGLAAAASVMVFTVMSHVYVKRNVYFAWLLVVLLALMVFASLADAISIGGPSGIYTQSRPASWIVALRSILILPVQIIFTGFFLWMSKPPWNSI